MCVRSAVAHTRGRCYKSDATCLQNVPGCPSVRCSPDAAGGATLDGPTGATLDGPTQTSLLSGPLPVPSLCCCRADVLMRCCVVLVRSGVALGAVLVVCCWAGRVRAARDPEPGDVSAPPCHRYSLCVSSFAFVSRTIVAVACLS